MRENIKKISVGGSRSSLSLSLSLVSSSISLARFLTMRKVFKKKKLQIATFRDNQVGRVDSSTPRNNVVRRRKGLGGRCTDERAGTKKRFLLRRRKLFPKLSRVLPCKEPRTSLYFPYVLTRSHLYTSLQSLSFHRFFLSLSRIPPFLTLPTCDY